VIGYDKTSSSRRSTSSRADSFIGICRTYTDLRADDAHRPGKVRLTRTRIRSRDQRAMATWTERLQGRGILVPAGRASAATLHRR